MAARSVFERVQADLQEAQAEIETASKVDGSLGASLSFGFTSLLAAVGQLFASSDDHDGKIKEHDRQLKIVQEQISALQSEIHWLRIAKGKAVAAKERALAKAQTAIDSTKGALENITLH